MTFRQVCFKQSQSKNLALLPRSCEDFRHKQRHTTRRPSLIRSKSTFLNLHSDNEGLSENVIIDIDGGGPLKALQVTCISPPDLNNSTKNINKKDAKKIVGTQQKQALQTSKYYNSGSENESEELLGQYDDESIEMKIRDEEDGEVILYYNCLFYN